MKLILAIFWTFAFSEMVFAGESWTVAELRSSLAQEEEDLSKNVKELRGILVELVTDTTDKKHDQFKAFSQGIKEESKALELTGNDLYWIYNFRIYTEDNSVKNVTDIANRPYPTLLHYVATVLKDGPLTQLLLEAGANPNYSVDGNNLVAALIHNPKLIDSEISLVLHGTKFLQNKLLFVILKTKAIEPIYYDQKRGFSKFTKKLEILNDTPLYIQIIQSPEYLELTI